MRYKSHNKKVGPFRTTMNEKKYLFLSIKDFLIIQFYCDTTHFSL